MSPAEESVSPLTFDIKEELLARVASFQAKSGARSLSDVVRYAVGVFDFGEYEAEKPAHRQLSVRLPAEQKALLLNAARSSRVSVGEVLRAALDALPTNPPRGLNKNLTQNIAMPAKKPAKKAPAKKACGCKKGACAVKKAPAKKAAAKKAPAKKAPAKKAVAKKAPAKKAVAKKAPAKKAVKKVAKKK